MQLRLIVFVFITFIASMSVSIVYAADAVVGTGTAGSCTESAFDTALAAAQSGGGTITFDCGGTATITFTSQKILDAQNSTIVIDGGGQITLSGGNSTRLFRVANGRNQSLTLRNITLANGRAQGYPNEGDDNSQGGAVLFGYGNDTLRIENSQFLNNTAVTNGFMWDGGGAIHIRIGHLVIEDSLFEGNTAPNGGAMNILITTGSITDTIFRNNSATTTTGGGGGAIYIDNGQLTMERILVENNTSTRFAAGYFNCGGSANIGHETIIDSTFRNNVITSGGMSGAGVYNCDDGITISGTTINNNVSPNHAGGFWHHSNSTASSTATVYNTTISGNVAQSGNGAGVTNNGPARMTIVNSTITGNATGVQGSAVRAGNSPVTFINTIIADNTSENTWNYQQCHGSALIDGGGNLQYPAVNEDGNSAICMGSFTTADARLAPLQDNGGNTETHALLAGSPALDAGSCALDVDQRGVARPQGNGCDIGAYESDDDLPSLAAPSGVTVDPGQGRPTITWANDGADWYNIWIGSADYTRTLNYEWYPKDSSQIFVDGQSPIICEGMTCTLKPNINPTSGSYEVWMRSWSEELGMSRGGTDGWGGAFSFTMPNTPAGFVTNMALTGTNSSSPTFSWTAPEYATWYQFWVGTTETFVTSHHNWYFADDLNCADQGDQCALTLDGLTFPAGEYVWYVQTWGPGGIRQNELGGWVESDTFNVGSP